VKPLILLLLAAWACCADLAVTSVWSRATMPGQEAGAVFATISGGTTGDRLLSASCPLAAVTEIHEHAAGPDGVMQMREVAGGLAIPADGTVLLKPRSYHLMLIGLKQPLIKGTPVAVTLVFRDRGPVSLQADVLDPWAMAFDDR
jgi:copper(I)-binding protein